MEIAARSLVLTVLSLLFVCGCDSTPEPRNLAVVNGTPITDVQVRDGIRVKAKIREFGGKKIPEKDFKKWANKEAARAFPEFVTAKILEDGLLAAGITPGTNDTARVLAKYNLATRHRARTSEELAKAFGDLAEEFRYQFRRSCLFEAFNNHFRNPEVTDDEIEEFITDQEMVAKVAEQLDKTGKANAEKAWKRLNAGEKWETVAKECSEDKLVSPGNESFKDDWATVDKEGLGYPELAIALKTLKKGDYSKPLDVDEGLIIVKVLDEHPGKKYTLARMLFRMAEPVTIPSREEARVEVRQRKADRSREKFIKELRAKAVVTYPCGTNFNFKVFGG